MADSATKILSLAVFLVLISQGYGAQCSLSDISVSQTKTGATVKGKPEWSVTVTNKCTCVQSNVVLNTAGFQTTEPIDPKILRISGNSGVLNDGLIIYTDPISFKYAWDNSFPLNPISSQIACS
ncbi:hypothetical protein VNO77_01274 [Canavalia gladiata]|uniref:Uncharacterized protein n=1 Tax=Canavalia gladiata TaxID=3824 RepID=A0AAN9MVL2_CANGL